MLELIIFSYIVKPPYNDTTYLANHIVMPNI